MQLKITHKTEYSYGDPVSYGLQQVRLTPQNSRQQRVLNWEVEITGGQQELAFADAYDNHTLLVQADPGTTGVAVQVSGVVETLTSDGVLGEVFGTAPLWHFTHSTPRTAAGKRIAKLAKGLKDADNVLGGLHQLSKDILRAVPYGKGETIVGTTAEEAVQAGGGVCQDHAQIFVSAARLAGLPARYVSGYLMMNNRVDQDASHAWAEAYVAGLGWVGFDVSNGISPDERYVRLATGLDSHDAAPITGMRLGQSTESMIVSLQVQQ